MRMQAPCGPVAIAVGVLILAVLAAGWAHAAPHKDSAPKVGDHYQPATDDGSHKVERAPARKVCEHDAQGRVVRCRELRQ